MWISKLELQRINERLADLERWKNHHEESHEFTVSSSDAEKIFVYHGGFPYGQSVNLARRFGGKINIKDVIEKILERLGVNLIYVSGAPPTINLQKKPKAQS